MRFELPILGVSDIVPASERQGRTTRYMVNMVAPDPATKQVRLSVRGGIEKFISTQVNGDSPVRAVRTATFQRKNVAYAAKASTSPGGALLFTCNGRGTCLFGEPHHDAGCVRDAWGDIPLAGFFAAGELGPVGNENFMHGFTASIAVFE